MRLLALGGGVAVALAIGTLGPYDLKLLGTSAAPAATGAGVLVSADSPFGVAVTEDGVSIYDVRLELAGLPEPATLGAFRGYVAWAALPDLSRWQRLGPVHNGVTTVGPVAFNKFLLVITAEPDSTVDQRSGPIVLHGISPSSWLQSLLSHPLFKGIPPG